MEFPEAAFEDSTPKDYVRVRITLRSVLTGYVGLQGLLLLGFGRRLLLDHFTFRQDRFRVSYHLRNHPFHPWLSSTKRD